MNTQLTPYQTKVAAVRDLLNKTKGQVALALPKHVTPERMLRVCMTAIQRTPKLLDADPRSLVGAIVEASQLGLEPDGVLGHAYLVPFNNKKAGKIQVQLIAGYKGLVELARRSGQISEIYAFAVHEADDFRYELGLKPMLRHRPGDADDPGKLLAVYAVARFRDGGSQFEVMRRREIEAIRQRSRASNDGPWVTDYEEMAKKTVLRRLCKMLPVSIELQKVVALDEHADAGVPQQFAAESVLPAPPVAVEQDFAAMLNAPDESESLDSGDDPQPAPAKGGGKRASSGRKKTQPEPAVEPDANDPEIPDSSENAGDDVPPDVVLDEWRQAIEQADSLAKLGELKQKAQALHAALRTEVVALCNAAAEAIRGRRGSRSNGH